MHGLPLWLAWSRFHPGMEKHAQAERISLTWTRLCLSERRTSPQPSGTLKCWWARALWGGPREDFHITLPGFLTFTTLPKTELETTWAKLLFKYLRLTILTQLLYNKKIDPISMVVFRPDGELADSQILTSPAKDQKHDGNNTIFCNASSFITCLFPIPHTLSPSTSKYISVVQCSAVIFSAKKK